MSNVKVGGGMKIEQVFRIEDGILRGTEITEVFNFFAVKYPHRKGKDLYIPPMKVGDKEVKTWHCCQEGCPQPDFDGGLVALAGHLLLHKGRLLKPWNKRAQLQSPLPAVKLPPNEWEGNDTGLNADRRFIVQLYIDRVKAALRKQGLEVIE